MKERIKRILPFLFIFLIPFILKANADPEISAENIEVCEGETAMLNINASEFPNGLSGYNITLSISNDVADIKSIEFPDWAVLYDKSSLPSNVAWIKAVDLNKEVEAGGKNVILAMLEIEGKKKGSAFINIFITKMDDDNGYPIEASIKSVKIEVIDSDNIPPNTDYNISGIKGENDWYISPISLKLFAYDDTGINITKYKINDGKWKEYKGGFEISKEGENVIQYYSVDNAGNEEEIKSMEIKIDFTSPKTMYSLNSKPNGNGWYKSNVEVILSSNDDASGIKEIRYKIDDKDWKKYEGKFLLGNGKHNIKYYSIDNAGNVEEIKSIEIKIDEILPEISFKQPSNYLYISGRAVISINTCIIIGRLNIQAIAADNVSGIEKVEFYVDDDLRYIDKEEPYEWSYDEACLFQKHLIKAIAYDFAGNVASYEQVCLVVNL